MTNRIYFECGNKHLGPLMFVLSQYVSLPVAGSSALAFTVGVTDLLLNTEFHTATDHPDSSPSCVPSPTTPCSSWSWSSRDAQIKKNSRYKSHARRPVRLGSLVVVISRSMFTEAASHEGDASCIVIWSSLSLIIRDVKCPTHYSTTKALLESIQFSQAHQVSTTSQHRIHCRHE